MKKSILSLAVFVAIVAFYVQMPANVLTDFPNYAVFEWESKSHDFGNIELKNPVSHEFTFTNTGDIPLIIVSAKASCGCTVADYTRDPIAPGNQGMVKATYNAVKEGVFSKTVTIKANTKEGSVVLTLKGEVDSAK